MEKKTGNRQFIRYIVFTFVIAWILQFIASQFVVKGNQGMFGICMSGCMFIPFLGTLIAGIPLKGMGWVPHLKGKVKWVFFALWIPAVLNLAGAVLYFLIFPGHFDAGFQTMKLAMGEEALAQMEAQGMTMEMQILLSSVSALTLGPVINMFLAIGEETGWRGAMYPFLKERFGKTKGRILGGIIWGAWHWPVMLLAGYEYGKDYIGAPFLGPAVFCLYCVFMGILEDIVYEKTGTIWGAALLHGAINAWTVYAYLLKPEFADRMIFGPATIGVISMIPVAVFVIVLAAKSDREVAG